ncbi:MAG TPA: hypothetical protein VKN36_03655 [Eudoraea sp.]|nr:hypothetical protein [Eudoraea sp.]
MAAERSWENGYFGQRIPGNAMVVLNLPARRDSGVADFVDKYRIGIIIGRRNQGLSNCWGSLEYRDSHEVHTASNFFKYL